MATGHIKKWVAEQVEGETIFKQQPVTLDPNKYQEVSLFLRQAQLVLFDEIDRTQGPKTYNTLSQCLSPVRFYGFSATIHRNDTAQLEIDATVGMLNLYTLSASDLIQRGVLVKPTIYWVRVPQDIPNPGKTYASIYARTIPNNETRNNLIVKYAKRFVTAGHTGIIAVNTLKHGKLLFKLLSMTNIRVEFLHGKHSGATRQKFIRLLELHDLDVIVTTLFDRGTNIPSLGFVIRAMGEGMSRSGFPHSHVLQLAGRVLRSCPNKHSAIIVDFYDPYPYVRDHSQSRLMTYRSESEFVIQHCS